MAESDPGHADPAPSDPADQPAKSDQPAEPSQPPESDRPAEPEQPGEPEQPAEPEQRSPRRRPRPGRVLRRSTTALVLFVLALATASYVFDLGPLTGLAGPSPISEPDKVPPPAGLTLPTGAAIGAVASPPEPLQVDPRAVRHALAGLLHDKRFGSRVAVDVNLLSNGTSAFHYGAHLVTPASTMKLLTTTAALEVLGPNHRFTTSAVTGNGSRQVVLVGGGDPLLAAGSPPDPSKVYPSHADLQTLAAATARSLQDIGRTKVRLRYDATLFTGSAVDPHWEPTYIPEDVVSPISALWVNEGRFQANGVQRSAHPAAYAAGLFAKDLADHGITVQGKPRPGTAPTDTTTLGSVQSAPLAQIVEHILEVSDNEGAEVLARQVAVAEGMPASFAGATRAVRKVLAGLGIGTGADTILDGSGLSRHDRLTPATLLSVLQTDSQPAHPELRPVITSLPVAGFTGSLAYRFQDAPRAGLGVVRAKTGTLTSVSGLAGVVTTRDGVVLDFVAIANRFKPKDTLWVRDRLDQIGSALAGCTCSAHTAPASSTP